MIDLQYMTEELSSESENIIHQHKLTWQSQGTNKLHFS